MRLFELHRIPKPPAKLTSATRVAEGCEFSDGSCVVRFASPSPHTALYSVMAGVATIGADEAGRGRLTIQWIFEPVVG